MSAAKHTPGPWEALDSMTVRGPFAMGDEEKPGFLIAQLPNYTPAEERAANARLIAAAPKMLQALAEASAALQGAADCFRSEYEDEGMARNVEEAALAANLVVALARGAAA